MALMNNQIVVTGIVLYTALFGEYDKRLVVLTKERGKITIFANGARKPNSSFRAASQSFVMGKFTVGQGRNSYNLHKVEVDEYFPELSTDIEKMCYASYFCEFISYYTREGDFCTDDLNLLYCSLKAIIENKIPLQLIKAIFEVKLMDIEGQGINSYDCIKCKNKTDSYYFSPKMGGIICGDCARKSKITKKISKTLVYTLQYIASSPPNKIFNFTLEDEALKEFVKIINSFKMEYIDKKFNSLEILDTLA